MLGVIIHSHCVRVGARVRIDIFVVISTVTDTYDENTQLNPVKPVPGQNLGPIIRSCPLVQKRTPSAGDALLKKRPHRHLSARP